ncbi:MAG: hypothetical protein Q3982_03820, partial [Phoenicibacter congonensis]|nr:hypothetical protein [Phoenicibacter congonensis]
EAISSMSTSTITEDFYKDLGNDLIEKLKSAKTRDGSVYFVYTKDGNNWDLNEDVTSTSLYNWVLS